MQCITCKTEVSSIFRYAIIKNECPACGSSIMDEESLAIIEHLKHTLSDGATLRDETAQGLAMMLFSTYKISLRNNTQPTTVSTTSQAFTSKPIQQNVKVAPSSTINEISKKTDQNIITAKEVNSISEAERDEIMEKVVKERYNMVDDAQIDLPFESYSEVNQQGDSVFTEGNTNPILERERIMRLTQQKQAMEGGGGVFRRRGD